MNEKPTASSTAPGSTDVRVLIVDDDALVRAGLRAMLDGLALPGPTQPPAPNSPPEQSRQLWVVGEASDGDEVPNLVRQTRPDVVLMDLRMRRCDGVAATRELRRRPDPPAVVALTTFDTDEHVLNALHAGASGFLLKDTPPTSLVAAICAAADGEPVLSPRITDRLIRMITTAGHGGAPNRRDTARNKLSQLTDRETDVAHAVGRGCSNAQIATTLHMSIGTVKAHVSHILGALDLDNRVQIALLVRDADV